MKRSTLIGLSFIIYHLSFSSVAAQSDDFGIWTEANIEKKLSSRLTLEGGVELRTRDDGFGELDRWSVSAGLEYKLTDWLKAGVSYSLLDDHNHKVNNSGKKYADYWGLRHRLNVSLTASQQWGNLTASLRERWQYTYRPSKTVDNFDFDNAEWEDHEVRGKGKNVLRSRLQLEWDIPKCKFDPFASVEFHTTDRLEKTRFIVGVDHSIQKKHAFKLYYRYQAMNGRTNSSETDIHMLGLGYTFKF